MGLSAVALAIGSAVGWYANPDSNAFEREALSAWSRGDLLSAEQKARQALGRSAESVHARQLLARVARRDGTPLTEVALLAAESDAAPGAAAGCFRAAELAFRHEYAAVAEHYWHRALAANPEYIAALDRLMGLSATRLDSDAVCEMASRRAQVGPLPGGIIRLLVGSEGLDRDAAELEPVLRRFVERDRVDLRSRLGLARCLLVLAQPATALMILEQLEGGARPAEWDLVRASALLHLDRVDEARGLLPTPPPPDASATYWLLAGSLALNEGNADAACNALKHSVTLRPLNRTIRARLTEALRRAGRSSELERSSRAGQLLDEIEDIAKDPNTNWNQATVDRLIRLCEAVDADRYVELLRQFDGNHTSQPTP